MSLVLKDALTGTQAGAIFVSKGNTLYNNSNNMCMCMCMYREKKRETRKSGRESKSQLFRWSLRVNKQAAREDTEGNVFH